MSEQKYGPHPYDSYPKPGEAEKLADEILEEGAMNEQIPKETHRGTINIMGIKLVVVTLDNGQRLIEADSFKQFLEAMETGDAKLTKEDATALAQAIRGISDKGSE